jgi:hypothetical protein
MLGKMLGSLGNRRRRSGALAKRILRDMGVEGDPEVYPAHTFVSA